jgi:hypothetical protein
MAYPPLQFLGDNAPPPAPAMDPEMSLAGLAGPLAKTANRFLLRKAEDLAAKGAPRSEIWRDTGWGWTGHNDSQPYFEIPDIGASLTSKRSDPFSDRTAPLKSFLDHPLMYDAYPDVARVPTRLRITKGDESGGYSQTGTWTDPYTGATGSNAKERINVQAQDVPTALRLALHESGGHVLGNREGFPVGGSNKERGPIQPGGPFHPLYLAELKARIAAGKSVEDATSEAERAASWTWYRSQHGEAMARLVEARRKMTEEELRNLSPEEHYQLLRAQEGKKEWPAPSLAQTWKRRDPGDIGGF